MSRITVQDARGWVRTSKFKVDDIDVDLCDQIEAEVLGRINSTYDTSGWTTPATTPRLVRTVIAKLYVVFLYGKTYSEDEDGFPPYANRLQQNAEMLIEGIIDGTIELVEQQPESSTAGQPSFYPDDTSSAMCPTFDDSSLGPNAFSMGKVF